MKIEKRYFVGKNKPGVWASIYAYKPTDKNLFNKKGEIFAAIVIEGPRDFDSSIAGNLVLDILHETYFESKKDFVLESLEEAVKAGQRRLLSLIENDESAAISGINFDFVALVIKGNNAFSVRIGDGVLKVFRNGNLQDLSAGFKDPTGEKKYSVLSMPIKKDDRFFLSTPEALSVYDENEIFEALYEFNELGLKNKMLEDDSKIALLLLGIDMVSEGSDNEKVVQELDIAPEKAEVNFINAQKKEEAKVAEVQEVLETAKPTSMSSRKFNIDKLKDSVIRNIAKTKQMAVDKYQSFRDRKQIKPNTSENQIPDEVATQTKGDSKLQSKSTFNVYLNLLYVKLLGVIQYIKLHVLNLQSGDKVYVGRRNRQKNYRVIIIAVVFIFIFLVLAVRWRKNVAEQSRIKQQNEELISSIQDELDSIKSSSVFTINVEDNVADRERILTQINSLLDKIKNTSISEDYKSQIEAESLELESLKDKLLRIINVDSGTLFIDFGASYEGAKPSDIAIVGSYVYVSDEARNVIYKIDANANIDEINKDFDSIRLITDDPEGDGLLILDNSSTALGLLNLDSLDLKRFVGMTNNNLASIVEMDAYEVSKNDVRLYLANQSSPQVQQINKRGKAYSDGPKSRWDDVELDGITDIALINGKFVLVKPQVGILRYFATSQINTVISGLLNGDSLADASKVDVAGQYIYIADSKNHRILVFTSGREGQEDYLDLIAQYRALDGNMFNDIKDIVVGSNFIYVLDDSKLYKLDLASLQDFKFN